MNLFRGDFAIGLRAGQAKRELRMRSEEAHAKRRCRSGSLNALKRVTAHLGVPRETRAISVPGLAREPTLRRPRAFPSNTRSGCR